MGIENRCKGMITVMDVRFKLGCKRTENMKGRINGMWFCRFKIFGAKKVR